MMTKDFWLHGEGLERCEALVDELHGWWAQQCRRPTAARLRMIDVGLLELQKAAQSLRAALPDYGQPVPPFPGRLLAPPARKRRPRTKRP